MKSCSKPIRLTPLCLAFLAALVFYITACDKQQARTAPPPPEVVTMEVKQQQVTLTTELPGRTSSYLVAEVRPQVSGIVQERLFEEGSMVNAEQLLYQIDPAPFQAAYDSAVASLDRAQASLPPIKSRAKRYKELLSSGSVSQQDFDDVDSSFKQAQADIAYWEAAVKTARINLDYTRVTAPISGRIGKSNMTRGALVTANQPTPLATIQQMDPIYVDLQQSTTDLMRLKHRIDNGKLEAGETVRKKIKLVLEDGFEYPVEGTLGFRDVTVDPTTGTVTLRAVFPNPDDILLPGMFVRAVMMEGINSQAIIVPQQAVSRDPKGNALVLTVDQNDTVQQRPIKIDRAMGNQWLVASGLAVGDRVVIEGMLKVRPGMKVHAIPSDNSEQTPAQQASAGTPASSN